ncbi:hypothetical protein ACFQU1_21510 [Chelatococcus sp. GCM10030263]|jgi:hypothetical protein|uniref:hypothetical protein n=1 Tax=Chelatococcus sp. GCM10030263 TaxID=3273387 RepID=UPI0036234623
MRRVSVLSCSAILLSAFALVSPSLSAKAAESTFVIPASDGYGVADCLATGGDCANGVANAWCVAQGYRQASGFHPASDVTSSTGALPRRARNAVVITCDN